MNTIKLIKINRDYASDPNLAIPMLRIYDNWISLHFPLNYYIFPFHENSKAIIRFENCLMFRSGDPNDEGFYGKNNNTRWKYEDFSYVEVDDFYVVENSDWQTNFGPDAYINQNLMKDLSIPKEKYKHFVFFMKEGTFECVATDYKEEIPYN